MCKQCVRALQAVQSNFEYAIRLHMRARVLRLLLGPLEDSKRPAAYYGDHGGASCRNSGLPSGVRQLPPVPQYRRDSGPSAADKARS